MHHKCVGEFYCTWNTEYHKWNCVMKAREQTSSRNFLILLYIRIALRYHVIFVWVHHLSGASLGEIWSLRKHYGKGCYSSSVQELNVFKYLSNGGQWSPMVPREAKRLPASFNSLHFVLPLDQETLSPSANSVTIRTPARWTDTFPATHSYHYLPSAQESDTTLWGEKRLAASTVCL